MTSRSHIARGVALLVISAAPGLTQGAAKRPMSIDDMMSLRTVGAPLAVVARWATQAVRCSALALTRQVAERRN